MANTALAHSTFEQINSLSQLHIVRQLGFILLLAAGIALGTAVVMWSRDPDFVPLYPSLSQQDASAIMGALDASMTDYRIDQRTGTISVPAAQVQQVRLELASQGLPRTGTDDGFSMLYESSTLGTSNFIEQARYNRALEQELVTTIKLIRGVRDARVHLSIPKQSTFLRSSNKPSASVMLDVATTGTLSDVQIAGIAHLVASSVTGLSTEDVSIVDQKGALLSKSQDSEYGASSEHIKQTRSLEEEYTKRILGILSPVVGEGSVRAQVTADLDFTVVETTAENYNPANVVLRSEQTSEQRRTDGNVIDPGALSATPPTVLPDGSIAPPATPAQAQAAGASDSQSQTSATRNYEVDKSVSYTRSVPGSIRRLSVAVLVDLTPKAPDGEEVQPLAPEAEAEKVARLTQLVKDTIGFNEARGDSVNVISERFSAEPVFSAESTGTPVWQQPWVPSVIKQALAGIVVLLLIFSVLKPALKSVVTTPKAKHAPQPAAAAASLQALPNTTISPAALEQSKKPPARSQYDENLQLAQTLVENEPARAARMIEEWVAND